MERFPEFQHSDYDGDEGSPTGLQALRAVRYHNVFSAPQKTSLGTNAALRFIIFLHDEESTTTFEPSESWGETLDNLSSNKLDCSGERTISRGLKLVHATWSFQNLEIPEPCTADR